MIFLSVTFVGKEWLSSRQTFSIVNVRISDPSCTLRATPTPSSFICSSQQYLVDTRPCSGRTSDWHLPRTSEGDVFAVTSCFRAELCVRMLSCGDLLRSRRCSYSSKCTGDRLQNPACSGATHFTRPLTTRATLSRVLIPRGWVIDFVLSYGLV